MPTFPAPRPRRQRPTLRHERACLAEGATLVCGVDEAGRGPLAGPVTAAAVILPARGIPRGLDDSKKLEAPERARLAATQGRHFADEVHDGRAAARALADWLG